MIVAGGGHEDGGTGAPGRADQRAWRAGLRGVPFAVAVLMLAAGLYLVRRSGTAPSPQQGSRTTLGARAHPYRLELDEARGLVVGYLQRSDRIEICFDLQPAGPHSTPAVLGTVRRTDDAKRWSAWTADLAGSHQWQVTAMKGPPLRLRFLHGTDYVGEVTSFAGSSLLGVGTPDGRSGQIQFASSLNGLLSTYAARARAMRLEASRQQEKNRSAAPRPQPSARPPARDFAQARSRIVSMFRECTYINLPPPGGAVDVTGEGRTYWQKMVRAVEKAPRGWAIPGPSKTFIVVMTIRSGEPVRPVHFDYASGQLGSADPYYGSDAYTLAPGQEFDAALKGLLTLAEERDRRRKDFARQHHLPRAADR